MKTKKLTFPQIRKMFWNDNPQFKNEYRKTYKQNQYNTDIRCTFVDFLDYLYKDGHITKNQANKCTL
jgi:hypothetical protein